MKLELEISDTNAALLAVLADAAATGTGTPVADVVAQLIDHAAQGVYRPGAWERPWLCQAFGDEFLTRLEWGDPYGRPHCENIFQRPRHATTIHKG